MITSKRSDIVLSVEDLSTYFYIPEGVVKAVDCVNLVVKQGETVALVGESGSGKSTLAFSVMKLVPFPGRIVSGMILYKGKDLTKLSGDQMSEIRGKEISMVFQDPMSCLNPVMKVNDQIAEAIILHQHLSEKEARQKVAEVLGSVRIPSPRIVQDYYPHQLSGGMTQRILIAMAVCCNAPLIIMDEPTTALDVTVQGQIWRLIRGMKQETTMSLLLITHDLGIVAGLADTVYVMYAGNIVERGDVYSIYDDPRHYYTRGLFESVLSIDSFKEKLVTMKGSIPDMLNPPEGCRFHPRCPAATNTCKSQKPFLDLVGNDHYVSCWLQNG